MIKYLTSIIIALCGVSAFGQYTFKEHYFFRNSNDSTNNKLNYLEFNAGYNASANNFSNTFIREIYNSGSFTNELKQDAIGDLKPVNSIGFGGLTNLVYKRKLDNFNFRIGLSTQIVSNNKLSEDLVKLALNGNAPYADESLTLGNTEVKIDAFHKLSIGVEKVVKDKYIIGGGINLYQGYFHYDMNFDKGDFFTESDGSEVRLDAKFDQSYSNPNDKGYGAGLDFYFVSKYKKSNFIFHVEDLGFIKYRNLTTFKTDSSFAFSGVEILDIFNTENSSIGIGEDETVHKFFGIESDTSSKTIVTPAKVTIGLQEQVSDKLFVEVYANYQLLATYIPQLIVKPNFFLNKNFSVAPVITLGGYGKMDYGLNLSYHHSNYFVVLDLFEFENLIAPNVSSSRSSSIKAGLLF